MKNVITSHWLLKLKGEVIWLVFQLLLASPNPLGPHCSLTIFSSDWSYALWHLVLCKEVPHFYAHKLRIILASLLVAYLLNLCGLMMTHECVSLTRFLLWGWFNNLGHIQYFIFNGTIAFMTSARGALKIQNRKKRKQRSVRIKIISESLNNSQVLNQTINLNKNWIRIFVLVWSLGQYQKICQWCKSFDIISGNLWKLYLYNHCKISLYQRGSLIGLIRTFGCSIIWE